MSSNRRRAPLSRAALRAPGGAPAIVELRQAPLPTATSEPHFSAIVRAKGAECRGKAFDSGAPGPGRTTGANNSGLRHSRTMKGALHSLTRMGVELWLDEFHRDQMAGIEFSSLLREHPISGVTVDPAAVHELFVEHVRQACDALRPIFDSSNGASGLASIQVDPRLADNPAATVEDARGLVNAIHRPNVLIKIPATHNGLAAIRACVSEGIQVNVALIFGLRRYAQVIDAYMDGLERRLASGGEVRGVNSVATFLVSPMDAEVGKRVSEPAALASLHGRVSVANARLAFRLFQQSLSLPRWTELAAAGARPQRLVWAALDPADPSLPPKHYVIELAVRDIIMSAPVARLQALDQVEDLRATWTGDEQDSRAVLTALSEAGVDYDELVLTLERESVRDCVRKWEALLFAVEQRWISPSRSGQNR